MEIVKHVSLVNPVVPLSIVDEWLRQVLLQPDPMVELEAISSLLGRIQIFQYAGLL